MSDQRIKVIRDTLTSLRLREFASRLEVAGGHIEATGYRVTEVTRDGDTLTRRVVADGKGDGNWRNQSESITARRAASFSQGRRIRQTRSISVRSRSVRKCAAIGVRASTRTGKDIAAARGNSHDQRPDRGREDEVRGVGE